jgi:hypothetical protein
MINRDDMLELTRRMTPTRTCFDRIAGAYLDECGEIEDSFNIHFGKLSGSDKARNLALAKAVPFGRTNDQLKEYTFSENVKGTSGMWRLLEAIRQCGLKNDALMEVLYEQLADAYPVDQSLAVYVFHGVYDIPVKAKDKESLWESEDIFDFIICTVSPLIDEYRPGEPIWGFLYPAYSERCADRNGIDIYHQDSSHPENGVLYKLTGKVKR